MQQDGEYIKIDVLKILNGMVRRIGIIIIAMLLCGAMAFSWAAFFIAPLYESTVLMYVNNSSFSVGATNFSISSSEITAAKSLVDTYIVILKTRMTLNEVISTGEVDYTYEELLEMIEAESVSGTEVFSVTVTSKDPQEAEHIANTIGLVLPSKIADVVEGSSVRIVDYAVVPAKKSSPSISKYTMVGLIIGCLVSCAAIAVTEIRDNTIHSEEYLLTNYKNIPLLSVIPDLLERKGNGYHSYYNYYSEPDEEKDAKKESKTSRK
ncbi:MAG: hypothetical protein IIX93_08255 [Clostridia bacterium]|nr:hypothetical protein [Clostridia bacterium]